MSTKKHMAISNLDLQMLHEFVKESDNFGVLITKAGAIHIYDLDTLELGRQMFDLLEKELKRQVRDNQSA